MAALELSPTAAGLAEAPWPPAKPNKRAVTVAGKDSFLDLCTREKCSFPDLMKLNFELDIRSPALKGKWERVVNYYLRKHLGCTKLTPGGNYKFSGGETIYIPTSGGGDVVVIDEPFVIQPRPGSTPVPLTGHEKSLLRFAKEFEFTLKETPIRTNAFVGKQKVAFKGKFFGLDSDAELKVSTGLLDRKIGPAVAAKITDDISIQAGSKLKFADLFPLNGKNFFNKLREAAEATIKGNVFRPSERTTVSLEGGLQASTTPIVIKIAGQWEGKFDAGKYLEVDYFPVGVSLQIQVTWNLAPTPALISMLKDAAAAAARSVPGLVVEAAGPAVLMIGFIALGIWDYGRRIERADRRALLGYYVLAYEARIFGGVPGFLGVSPGEPDYAQKVDLVERGRKDADTDAVASFSGLSEAPHLAYLRALLIAGGGGTTEARNLLGEILWRRLQEKFQL